VGRRECIYLAFVCKNVDCYVWHCQDISGTDFLKYFRQKMAKKLEFLTQNKAELCTNLIITLVFEGNANFFVEIRQKSQKIVGNHNIDPKSHAVPWLLYSCLQTSCNPPLPNFSQLPTHMLCHSREWKSSRSTAFTSKPRKIALK
jgi:hypothetical protein